mmetsp:Transcript_31598/g.102217  ORF Transcript_31598/g.102217 Transcript_31598/m.102217 type:complete len:251 (+) Transcript_31598:2468-3220(+)
MSARGLCARMAGGASELSKRTYAVVSAVSHVWMATASPSPTRTRRSRPEAAPDPTSCMLRSLKGMSAQTGAKPPRRRRFVKRSATPGGHGTRLFSPLGRPRAAEAIPMSVPLRSTKYWTGAAGGGAKYWTARRTGVASPRVIISSTRHTTTRIMCSSSAARSRAMPSHVLAGLAATVRSEPEARLSSLRSQSSEPRPVEMMAMLGSLLGSQSCRPPTKPTQHVTFGCAASRSMPPPLKGACVCSMSMAYR